MSTIHQAYCTHCTHGSSALEKRDGELAERTFGYSVRAGSLETEALRKWYQQIEPMIYYHLPRDTPDEQKLQQTPATAPRRFLYVPAVEGFQVCGQVCYRSADSEGRPGSYFAHLVFQEEGDGSARWSPAEVLRLWSAPGWVTQDSPEIPFQLEPLASLSDLLQGGPAAVDDPVLASFLREPEGSASFVDPAGVVPERWRAMEPQTRRDWFLGLLATFLRSATSEREPLVLIAEPGLAALLFYGMMRLLPPGPLRDAAGMSTFESDPDQAASFLAATWFFDPRAAVDRPEACPWQKTTINTLADRESQKMAPATAYAQTMVRRFLDVGGEAIDRDLRAMAAVRITGTNDLDTLIEIDAAVDGLFERGKLSPAPWQNWPGGVEYLRQKIGQRLAGIEDLDAGLKPVVGGHAHLAMIDILTGKPAVPGARHAVVHLLKELPPEKILGLLKLGGVPDEDKITVLLRHIHAHGDLPPGCEFLWEEWATAAEQPRRGGVVLMARILAKLPAKDMQRFYSHVPPRRAHGFLRNCLRLVRQKKMKLQAFSAMLRAADDESVFRLIRDGGEKFLADYPRNEPALGEKLVGILRTLPKHPEEFKERLDLLLAGQHLLGEEVYHEATASWDKCYKAIQEVGRRQQPDAAMSTEKRHALLLTACREMAMAADRAMTIETMDGEYPWNEKRDFLLKIGQRVLGGTPLFIPGAWETEVLLHRVDTQFQQHRFPTDPIKKEAVDKKKEEKKKEAGKKLTGPEAKSLATTSNWLTVGIVVSIAGIVAMVIGGVYWIFYASGSGSRPKQKGPRDRARKGRSTTFDWRKERSDCLAASPLRIGRGRAGEEETVGAALPACDSRPLTAAVLAEIPAMVHHRIARAGLRSAATCRRFGPERSVQQAAVEFVSDKGKRRQVAALQENTGPV